MTVDVPPGAGRAVAYEAEGDVAVVPLPPRLTPELEELLVALYEALGTRAVLALRADMRVAVGIVLTVLAKPTDLELQQNRDTIARLTRELRAASTAVHSSTR